MAQKLSEVRTWPVSGSEGKADGVEVCSNYKKIKVAERVDSSSP